MLFFSICVGLVGGDMRGVVRAFEAKLNKFLNFYAISILKIEMLIYRWRLTVPELVLFQADSKNNAGLQIWICSPAVFSVFNQSLTEAIMLQPAGR